MNPKAYAALEFQKIKDDLSRFTLSYAGQQHVQNLTPATDKKRIERWLEESEEAKRLIESGGSVPIPTLDGIERVAPMLGKRFVFTGGDFDAVTTFLRSTLQLQSYLHRKQEIAPRVSAYGEQLHTLTELCDEIERCILHGEVHDGASDALRKARKQASIVESRLRKKLDGLLQKYRPYLQESLVMQRSDRFVLAVRKDYRKLVPGSVLDESGSGQTVFIEPAEVAHLQLELEGWKNDIEHEKYRVLCLLSEQLDMHSAQLLANLETIGVCDFVVAKGKYARSLDANKVTVSDNGVIEIRQGRHPLLGRGSVPIDVRIGNGYRALVITGPNTGGKTATLKTVGLLTLMMQCGLLVPVERASTLAIYRHVLPDIGDGQSLLQSLSTFSAHIRNLVEILEHADERTLVLLDELASGTDPGEGIGLSIAVLERLYERGSTIIATTHFSEIKDFARDTPGFEVARMEFDVDTLQPLYRLCIGEAGQSYALLIAQKLGLTDDLIVRAKQVMKNDAMSGDGLVQVDDGQVDGKPTVKSAALRSLNYPLNHPVSDTKKQETKQQSEGNANSFQVGDRVWVHPMRQSGIVAKLPDERGNLVVMVKRKRHIINHKRLSPYLSREELYPDNYDLDIVLESKAMRKKRKLISKRHVEGLSIEYNDEPR